MGTRNTRSTSKGRNSSKGNKGKEPGKVIHSDKVALERAQLGMALTEAKRAEFDDTLSILDKLRATRKARGGVGAPLQVPLHLRAGTEIVITDADLDAAARAVDKDQLEADAIEAMEDGEEG